MTVPFDTAILEASYEGVRFPVSEAPYQGGHDLIEHRAYLRSGAVYEPAGRKAYSGRLVIPLVNTTELEREYGQLFPLLAERLRGVLETAPIGRLTHPILGMLTAAVREWSFEGTSENRSGTPLTLEWSEHNASVAEVVDLTETPGRSPEDVQRRADTADAAVAAAMPSAGALRPTIDEHLETVTDGTTRVSERESAFAAMDEAVLAVQELEGLEEAATALLELDRLRGAIQTLRRTLLDPLDAPRVHVLARTSSVAEVCAELYGTVSSEAMAALLAANSIARPLEIPAGARLRIPPRPST